MEKDDINTFARSEFFGGVYPVMTLGFLYLQWWVGRKVYFSSSANSRYRIDWVLLGTSEKFTKSTYINFALTNFFIFTMSDLLLPEELEICASWVQYQYA